MAANHPNRTMAARAAAILTLTEVAAAKLDLNETFMSSAAIDVAFTLGSLTNVVLRFLASMDGTAWDTVYVPAGTGPLVVTLTASGDVAIAVPLLPGYKFFRVTAQGTGVVTGSSLALAYRYLRRGSQ